MLKRSHLIFLTEGGVKAQRKRELELPVWSCSPFGSVTEGEILNGTKFLKRIETDIIELSHMGANESGETLQGRGCGRTYVAVQNKNEPVMQKMSG